MKKKTLALIAALLAGLTLAGCDDSQQRQPDCEWELEKDKPKKLGLIELPATVTVVAARSVSRPAFRSSSRSGRGFFSSKPKPSYSAKPHKPTVRPSVIPPVGHHWEWDCD